MKLSYWIEPEEYERLLKEQDHCCAVCGKHENDVDQRGHKYRRLVVDHCHTTGKVRGLLCHNCNILLGHAADNPDILQKALSYLEV